MDNVIAPIFWIGFVCCLPPLIIGIPIAYVARRNKQRRAGSEAVAAALGLEKVAQVKQMWWYQGAWENGRRLALIPIVIPKRSYSVLHDRKVTQYDSGVCLVIELLVDAPLDVEVIRHIKWSDKDRSLDAFDSAFNAENGSKLTGTMQQALLDFARRHPGTLWLRNRADMPLEIFEPPDVMAGAPVILLHEYRAKDPETETVRAKTADLAAVARTLEKIWRST